MTTFLKATVAASAAAIMLAASAGVAEAGTYVISNCPSAGNDNAGSWTIFGSPQADTATCSGGASSWIGPQGGSMGPNTSAGVTIAAPSGSGITIQHARVWWWVPSSTSGATTFAVAGTTGGTLGAASTPLDRTSTPDDFVLPSTSTSVTLTAYCSSDDYSNGCTYGAGEDPILQLHGAQLTLADSTPPSGAVTGGALAASGTVSGTQSLAFNATDGAAGVRLVQLVIDGQVVATNDYLSQCPYQNFAACPTTVSDAIAWNTSSVANGPHDVSLRIVNAAQVVATVDDHMVTIHNPPHTPNGAPACEQADLELTVNGRSSRALIHYDARTTIRGTLRCGTAPIVGATIAITGGGLNTSITTNQLGTFRYRVPRGPDRTVSATYRAFADDSKATTTARARVAVLPRIQLSISPRRTRNGGSITWRGRIQGGPYPRGGVTLLVEVKEGRRWQPFDEIIARKGRFAYRYTFLRTTQPTTYEFNVALPAGGSAGYHYHPSASKAIKVHVT